MNIHFVTDEKIAETSSKGNQEKWKDGDRWYKLDQFGYEALAESAVSCFLEQSNIETDTSFHFTHYRMERMNVHGRDRTGCSSENFLRPGQAIITLSRLFRKNNIDLKAALTRLPSDIRRISYLAETTADLTGLRDSLEAIIKDDKFAEAKSDIRLMHEDLSNVRAAVIGVNFTPDFDIERVSTIEFVPYGLRSKYTIMDIAAATKLSSPTHRVRYDDALLSAITPKMEKHLKSHFFEIKRTLTKYTKYDSSFLVEMYEGLTFYLRSAKLAGKLKENGYVITFPEIKPTDKSRLSVTGFYNIRLAFRGENDIVKNDFAFTPQERIFILTGPNRGGKTIFTQAWGIAMLLAQLGIYVPAESAAISPCDNIFTHFPADENDTVDLGRLGEESKRLAEIFEQATERSIMLLNESLATTSVTEGLFIAKDVVRAMRYLGTRCIFNTHMHDLARSVDALNEEVEGTSKAASLVTGVHDGERSFKVSLLPPQGVSYAKDIALKYGVSFRQIKESIDSRT